MMYHGFLPIASEVGVAEQCVCVCVCVWCGLCELVCFANADMMYHGFLPIVSEVGVAE